MSLSTLNVLLTLSLVLPGLVLGQDCSGFKPGAEQFATVAYKGQNRRGKVTKTVTEAMVAWTPQEMLSDISCFSLEDTVLMFKPMKDGAEWEDTGVKQRAAGQASKWFVEVKPCLQYQFAIKITGQQEAVFELPMTLGPATHEEIVDSGYIPAAPANFAPEVGAGKALLRWEESDCAERYELSFHEVGVDEYRYESSDADNVEVGELKPCTNYEVTINALLTADSDDFSEDLISYFATKPRLDAAAQLKIDVKTTMDTAAISWEAWKSVSCISQYELTICSAEDPENCLEPAQVGKPPGVPTVSYTATGLDPCTDYNLVIEPKYEGAEIETKKVSFRTLSPDAASLQVGEVTSEAVSSGSMLVKWQPVKCATAYRIYQKETQEQEWEQVAETAEQAITIDNITPCTQYHFALTAVIDEQETNKSVGPDVTTDLDENDPFMAPNLKINNADRQAELSWEHGDCIEGYLLKVCAAGQEAADCREEEAKPEGKMVNHKIENLNPCTQYSLEIVPLITGKVFISRQSDFTTTNGIPQPPENFVYNLDDAMSPQKASLTWDTVQCSTGYKMYQKVGDDEEESVVVQGLSYDYESLTPCLTYYFSVATLVDEQESEKTEWQSVQVPPRPDQAAILMILNNENDNITLRLDPPQANERCQPEQYELSYTGTGEEPYETKVITAEEDDDGLSQDLNLGFAGATGINMYVQGRIKYRDFDVWSDLGSSRKPGDRKKLEQGPDGANGEDAAMDIVPIAIGAIVVLVILVIIIVLVVLKRRNRTHYDAEKAGENGKKEETQKLNDNHPDA